jgi:hypothetical protein
MIWLSAARIPSFELHFFKEPARVTQFEDAGVAKEQVGSQ